MLINHGIWGAGSSRTCVSVMSFTAACRDLVIAAQEPEFAPKARGTRFIELYLVSLFFFAHLNCQRVMASREFLVLSPPGHMLYRAASYYAMSHVLCFGMFWFLNNAACYWGVSDDERRSLQWLKCSQLQCGTRTATRSKPRSRH